ncbi:hypothetical protein [Olivibacter sp. LS-1]|uniref:hypothetical protein n=1 Tax=Olivibacter sp. LS-1 TaxID=2592345 RepID=UPI001FEE8D9E|nr:hypothetical protein [Olivibacter sp. LS-1]
MALRLYDYELGDLLIKRDYPGILLSNEGDVCEQRTRLIHPVANGYFQEIYFDGIHIGYGKASFTEKVFLSFESDFETVEMHFALKGKSAAYSDRFGRSIGFESNQHNIIYANQMRGEMRWESKDIEICEINFSPAFFRRFLPEDSTLFMQFHRQWKKARQVCCSRITIVSAIQCISSFMKSCSATEREYLRKCFWRPK